MASDDENDLAQLSILVVDDETNIRKTLAYCLSVEGHEVIAVSNGADALNESRLRAFDMAFVDLKLGAEGRHGAGDGSSLRIALDQGGHHHRPRLGDECGGSDAPRRHRLHRKAFFLRADQAHDAPHRPAQKAGKPDHRPDGEPAAEGARGSAPKPESGNADRDRDSPKGGSLGGHHPSPRRKRHGEVSFREGHPLLEPTGGENPSPSYPVRPFRPNSWKASCSAT